MPLTTKDKLRQAKQRPPLRVDLPEFGDDEYVFVRLLSVRDARELYEWVRANKETEQSGATRDADLYRFMATLCLSDESGSRIFQNSEEAHGIVDELPLEALRKIFEAAQDYNLLSESARDEMKKKALKTANGSGCIE